MSLVEPVNFSEEKENYFSLAIEKIVQNGNTGYLPAFYNSLMNEEGVRFTQENFKKIMDENDVLYNWKNLPSDFVVTIRFSPIAFFKKWIFLISNRPLLKVSEYNTSKMFEREFFLLFIDNQIYLFSITNNLSHERFLYRLYFRDAFKEKNITFNTYFNDQKKLIIYKDYYKRKIFTIPFPGKNYVKDKLCQVRVSVIKDVNFIRYLLYINGHKINHTVKLNRHAILSKGGEKVPVEDAAIVGPDGTEDLKIKPKLASKRKSILKGDRPSLSEFRREVIAILAKNHEKEYETNKFANVSLGRVYTVPILVNLSQKFRNIKIKLLFKSKEDLLQIYSNGQLIKTFAVSFSPKSNWLERS